MSLNSSNLANTYFNFMSRSSGSQNRHNQPAQENKPSNTLSIFYVNDIHGQLPKLSHLKAAGDSFTRVFDNELKNDCFKISAGDTNIGYEPKKNDFLVGFLNLLGIDFSAIGNHELDDKTSNVAKSIDKANFKYICSNLEVTEKDPISKNIKDQKIVTSWTEKKNNQEYGFIGVAPVDLKERTIPSYQSDEVNVKNFDNTVKEIQKEVEALKSKGINRIILVSHLGFNKETVIAKQISGIDVIIGGHSHDLIDGVKPDFNQLQSPSGEPVIITQAGKDGTYFGILNATFDDKGKITKANNDIHRSSNYEKDKFVEYLKETFLGIPKPIGTLTNITYPQNANIEENPTVNLFADSMRFKTGAQVAFINSQNIRGKLNPGVITTRAIQDLDPFDNKTCLVELSEKDIIDTLNVGARSAVKHPYKPGIVQVSGLKYTVTKQNTVKDVFIENKDGSYSRLDHVSPSTSKKFIAAYDDFLINGPEGFDALKKTPIEKYDWGKTVSAIEYIKTFNNKPFELKKEDRIVFE